MLYKNIIYLIDLSSINRSDFCQTIGISEAGFWKWKRGSKPTPNTLRRIAKYFSDTLSIPLDLFEDGKALLEKDFEKLLTEAQILPKPQERPIPRTVLPISDLPSATDERDLIKFLRLQESGSDAIPLSSLSIIKIMRLLQVLGGLNSPKIDDVIGLFRHWGETSNAPKKD